MEREQLIIRVESEANIKSSPYIQDKIHQQLINKYPNLSNLKRNNKMMAPPKIEVKPLGGFPLTLKQGKL